MRLRFWPKGDCVRLAWGMCLCLTLAQQVLWADGVTRTLEPVIGGCKVTLAWEFAGKVESDLVIEERLAPGWTVNDSTVPFGSLDATWFSDSVARFAVKPSLLGASGSISFVVESGVEAATGTVSGDWQMYLDGTLIKGRIAGSKGLSALVDAEGTPRLQGEGTPRLQEAAVAISSFKVLDGSRVELSYVGLAKAGTLVVEGCRGLGQAWTIVKQLEVSPGGGKVELKSDEIDGCRFYRMKHLTKGE